MSREKQNSGSCENCNSHIEVITYEQDRLNYFTELMEKAQKRYKRLFKKFKDAPFLSTESEMLNDAGREAQFHGDVVEMLEKGYRKQSEGEWEQRTDVVGFVRCSVCKDCNVYDEWVDGKKWNYCPNCGAKMKGGAE